MKHKLLSLSIALALTACGDSNDDKNTIAATLPTFSVQVKADPNCEPQELPATEEGAEPEVIACDMVWQELAEDAAFGSAVATKISNPSGQIKINDANRGESLYYPLEASPAEGTATYGDFTFNSAGEWTYTLWQGNSTSKTPEHPDIKALVKAGLPDLTDSFTITTADGTEKVFTVTIKGIDENATFGGSLERSVARDSGKAEGKGTTSISDANPEEALFNPVLEQPDAVATEVDGTAKIVTTYGEVTITLIDPVKGVVAVPADPDNGIEEVKGVKSEPSKIDWVYNLDVMNADVIALVDSSEFLTDTFTLTSVDGTAQIVKIIVTGSDQVPASFVAKNGLTTTEDGSFSAMVVANAGSFIGEITVADPNFEEEFFKPLDASPTALGSVTIDKDGSFSYHIDHSKDAVKAILLAETVVPMPTIEETVVFETIDGTQAMVMVTIEGSQLTPAVIDGLPVVIDGVSTLSVNIKELGASGALTVTDDNSWQALFEETSFSTTYGSFSLTATGIWDYTLSNATVALIEAGTLDLPYTEQITVASVDGTEVTLPITIIGLDEIPPNKYLHLSSKDSAQGIINFDGFGKETKGKLTLDVRMTDGPYIGYIQLFGANSGNPAVSMVDLQLKPSGKIDIRDITDEDPSVKYPAGEWFPVEMTWDSTATPAQMSVKVDGQLVSDFASPTTADVSAGAFRLTFRCGRGSDNPLTECDFDNIKITQDTTAGEKVAVNEDFQSFELGEVNKQADTPLSSGGKIKKHSNGYKHLNSVILEEEVSL